MNISILDIFVTQVGLRNEAQLEKMIDFAKNGGYFTKFSIEVFNKNNPGTQSGWPIKISRFEDGKLFCADGHHRLAAIAMSGRLHLEPDEYEIQDWKYSDYTDINFDCKWVTPLDLRTEIRISDYAPFKSRAYELLSISEVEAIEFIRGNKSMYIVPRNMNSIYDLLVRKMFGELA